MSEPRLWAWTIEGTGAGDREWLVSGATVWDLGENPTALFEEAFAETLRQLGNGKADCKGPYHITKIVFEGIR